MPQKVGLSISDGLENSGNFFVIVNLRLLNSRTEKQLSLSVKPVTADGFRGSTGKDLRQLKM
jgi:hypothetical protein